MNKRLLSLNALSHLLVDACCAAALLRVPAEELLPAAYLYTGFAFSTQCLVGLATDRTGRCPLLASVSCLWVALAALLPLPWKAQMALVGLGNSLFHVSAGTVTLVDSGGKAAALGLFVAPGALGVFLGKTRPALCGLLCGLLALCGAALVLASRTERRSPAPKAGEKSPARLSAALLLLLAVAVRAVGGAAAGAGGSPPMWQSALLVLAVFLGKSGGGLICDRAGIRRTALISVPLAALGILLGGACLAANLAGQFFLNLSMPITLFLLYRCLPDSPGFAFGLAASVLWPGTLLGTLLPASGPPRVFSVLLCFGVALFSIIYAERSFSREKKP